MIVQRLHTLQQRDGYLKDEELKKLALELQVPLYRIQELVSFYPHYRPEWMKPPHLEVMICRDMSCHLKGSADWINDKLGLPVVSSEEEGRAVDKLHGQTIEIKGVSCLGRCDRAVACVMNRHDHADKSKGFEDRLFAGLSLAQMRDIVTHLSGHETDASGPEFMAGTPDIEHAASDTAENPWMIDAYKQYDMRSPDSGKTVEYDFYRVVRDYLTNHPQPIIYNLPEKAYEPVTETDPARRAKQEGELRKRKEADEDKYLIDTHPFLNELKAAYLQGMGGAGLPAFRKWSDVWKRGEPVKYVVGNGDESEPGTFKDRELLLKKPHLVVEGLLLGVLMTGSLEGYIFIRHEYTEQIAAMQKEMTKAKDLLAADFNRAKRDWPKIEVFTSPGNYICGEQSALLEAMEDRRAQPRNRPPELGVNGYRDCPTVVNNVETLAWVPSILLRKSAWYTGEAADEAKSPRERVSRRRLFSISGDLQKPGAFEVPKHATLGEVIAMAGGIREGRTLQAVATSGPSGGFLPARLELEHNLSPNVLKKCLGELRQDYQKTDFKAFWDRHVYPDGQLQKYLNLTDLPMDKNFYDVLPMLLHDVPSAILLGAGIVVYDDSRDMLAEARNCTQFFRNETCGKCVPCRIGTQKLVDVGTSLLKSKRELPADGDVREAPQNYLADNRFNLDANDGIPGFRKNMNDLHEAMKYMSICSLGQSAPSPLRTALRWFA